MEVAGVGAVVAAAGAVDLHVWSSWIHFAAGLLLVLGVGCLNGLAEETTTDCAEPPGLEAPIAEWISWRDAQVDYLFKPFHEHEEACIEITGLAERALCIRAKLEPHRHHLKAVAKLSGLGHFLRFIDAVSWQAHPEHEMGYPVPDREVLKQLGARIELPSLLRSPDFLKKVSHPNTYHEAQQMVDHFNRQQPVGKQWKTLWYQSRFIETPDRATHGRFLVWVPGPAEKWIQFGVLTPDMPQDVPVHGVSIISVWPKDEKQHGVAIVDYWRSYSKEGIQLQTKVEAGQGGANCYNCHKTGVLPIHPNRTYDFNAKGELVETERPHILNYLNDRIKKHQAVDFGFGFDPGGFGPTLGPRYRQRSIDQVREWIRPMVLSDQSLERVGDAMACSRCHHKGKMGRLNFPVALLSDHDFVDLLHPESGRPMPLAREYLVQGWMPPDTELNPQEREALYRALTREYFDVSTGKGLIIDWLKQETAGAP